MGFWASCPFLGFKGLQVYSALRFKKSVFFSGFRASAPQVHLRRAFNNYNTCYYKNSYVYEISHFTNAQRFAQRMPL